MKVNELRIGNWVNEFGSWHQIEAVDLMLDIFNPIPLTEDILLKCGSYTSDFDNNTTYRIQITIDYILAISLEFNTYQLGDLDLKEINSLHQLQNLYFALTGTELEVNL